MRKFKVRVVKIGVVLVTVGGSLVVGWSLWRHKSEIYLLKNTAQNNIVEPQRKLAAVPFKNSVSAVVNSAATVSQVAEPVQVIEKGNLPQPEIVQKFKIIQAKVFKSEADQKNLQQMLMDSKYLLQLGEYLRDLQSVHKDDFKTNQNAVMDLLLEALKSGDSHSAEQAILDIVKDAQVEDDKLSANTRELLGGVKAELLYHSTSIKPELSASFSKVLPGPVSQKIWQNVQQQQTDNLALSESERQVRKTQKH